MKHFAMSAAIASLFLSGAAIAQQATTRTGGMAEAGRDGAQARGQGAGRSEAAQQRRDNRRPNLRDHRLEPMAAPNSASTSTQGSVYTNRRSGAAAITTQGAASGAGGVSSSSQGEVYSRTDRQGSEADAYGASEAEARQRREQPDPERN